ncbi:MAG: 2OG-Fe(II) oxygenase [Chitinophagaceae bacterium]|nr:2OG-Fe(II) oxygenase [Oligoflexus sp.]
MPRRIKNLNWARIADEVLDRGFSETDRILSDEACGALKAAYDDTRLYRKTIVMQRYSMGRGEYKYFDYPLPSPVQALRSALYEKLHPIALEWCQRLGMEKDFPQSHDDFLKRCKEVTQSLPTPLILKYGPGDYNCLHQDLYGEEGFPFQVIVALSDLENYEGGELVLTKQRPRLQTIPYVLRIPKGHAIVTTTHFHAQKGVKGFYRAPMRHGVSAVRSGERFTLGLIFHDARP